MHYYWTPTGDWLRFLHGILPRQAIYGGGSIGPPSRLAELQAECHDYAEDSWLIDFPKDRQEWLRSVPFLRMPNSDCLALDPELHPSDPPVIYLCHDGENQIVAKDFISFLSEWERLAYVGPEIWIISEFRDGSSGYLDSETAKSQALRNLFRNRIRQ
jgi:hypothetical protein